MTPRLGVPVLQLGVLVALAVPHLAVPTAAGAPAAADVQADVQADVRATVVGGSVRTAARPAHRVTLRDRTGERVARHVDLRSVTLTHGRRRTVLTYRFARLVPRHLTHVVTAIDVNRSSDGYLVVAERRGGRLRPSLEVSDLFDVAPTSAPVRCRGLRVDLDRRRATVRVVVPRRCLTVGGRKARFRYSVSDADGHHDSYLPGSDRFSRWATRPATDRQVTGE